MASSPSSPSEDAAFDSVGSFLKHVQLAKSSSYQTVSDQLEPFMTDPSAFAIDPRMGQFIDDEVESYGDEALKQLTIVALGKWLEFHQGFLQEHMDNGAVPEALLTMRDISTLTAAIRLIEEVGSFGGDEDYRKAKHKQISQAVLENIEESGRSPEEVFNGESETDFSPF